MAYTRKQLVACVSIVYLIVLTAVAGYASSRGNGLSIPIPNSLSSFTTALPIVAGLLLKGGYDLSGVQQRGRPGPKGKGGPRLPLVIVVNTLILIYSTVIMTLLGTHVAPLSQLSCGLDRRWMELFTHKNDRAIRIIQDTFSCCGYVNSHDKAWPFPDKSHDQHACEKAFDRTTGCFGPWRREEQRVAGLLMAVVGFVFVWQLAIIVTPTSRESWLNRILPDRVSRLIVDSEGGRSDGPRRAIDYLPNGSRYRDSVPGEEVQDEEAHITSRRAIEADVAQEHQHLPVDNAWARN